VLFKNKFGRVNELKQQRQDVGGVAYLQTDGKLCRNVYYLITKQNYWEKPTYAYAERMKKLKSEFFMFFLYYFFHYYLLVFLFISRYPVILWVSLFRANLIAYFVSSLRASLVLLRSLCDSHKVNSLALPRIGCGLDGLIWREVKIILKEVFWDSSIQIRVFRLE
jgi:hypothetical protein